jgi:hypothetical protein
MSIRVCLVCAALMALGACDGSSISFPVDGGKQLDELTDEDARAICHALKPMFDSLDDLMCTSKGISKSMSGGGSCEAERSACLQGESITKELDCNKAKANDLANCDATVGSYEACANDTYSMIKDVQSSVRCGASISELQALETKYKLPASCEALQQKCPSISIGID